MGEKKRLRGGGRGVRVGLACGRGFGRRSVGFVGASDGWQDVMNHFKMIWEFSAAENGNIALTGEIDLQGGDEFTIAVSLSGSYQSAATNVLQSLATPLDLQHQTDLQPLHAW